MKNKIRIKIKSYTTPTTHTQKLNQTQPKMLDKSIIGPLSGVGPL